MINHIHIDLFGVLDSTLDTGLRMYDKPLQWRLDRIIMSKTNFRPNKRGMSLINYDSTLSHILSEWIDND